MTARHNNMYREIYGTRTPRYDAPPHRHHGAAVALTGAAVALLALAPDRVAWLTELGADLLARLP